MVVELFPQGPDHRLRCFAPAPAPQELQPPPDQGGGQKQEAEKKQGAESPPGDQHAVDDVADDQVPRRFQNHRPGKSQERRGVEGPAVFTQGQKPGEVFSLFF